MSLGNILTDIASLGGVDLNDTTQLTYIAFRVNKAAKEIYEEFDLIGCLREQVFRAHTKDGDEFTLPWYVGKVKAVRYFFPELNIRAVDMRPRYVGKFWQTQNFLSWRIKEEQPLIRDIKNAGLVLVRFRTAETGPINVTIIGSTEFSSQAVETIVVPLGNTQGVQSANAYTEISSIAKNAISISDCDLYDLDGQIISTIPNNQLKANYQRVQIINLPNKSYSSATAFQPVTDFVECLWKLPWKPMVSSNDEFICPGYDAAIFWKYMEHKARTSPQTAFDANQAEKFKDACEKIIKDRANQNDETLEKSLNFGENTVYEAFANISQNQILTYYPTDFPSSGASMVWP